MEKIQIQKLNTKSSQKATQHTKHSCVYQYTEHKKVPQPDKLSENLSHHSFRATRCG